MTLKEEIKLLLIGFAFVPPIILLFAICMNLADIRFVVDLAMFPFMKHKQEIVYLSSNWTDIFNLMLLYLCVLPFVIAYTCIKHKRKKMR